MLETLFHAITVYIAAWGYWGIFWGMVLANANIPVPSEIVLGFAGFLVFTGQLDFVLTVVVATVAGVVGSVASYLVGYYGGPGFVRTYGRYVLLSESKLRLTEQWFERSGIIVTFYGRLIPLVRAFVSLPAGFAKMNFALFMLYTIAGSLVWSVALVYLGMALGENWQQLGGYIDKAAIAAAALFAAWFLFRRLAARST
jgi:membrane protein DedA with SNARE-associated domain